MITLIHILALIGTTLLITESTIFAPIRKIGPAMLKCAQCVGTWVGAVGGASGIVAVGHGRFLDALVLGAATSFLSLLAAGVLIALLGETTEGH